MDLSTASTVLRLLADPTRVRLLALLDREELTVAELAAVLHLAQPRVSTHLAKLKEAELVRDRRAGVSAYYRANAEADPTLAALVASLRDTLSDALLREDAERLPAVLAQRARAEGWADTVAGDMERHYSPGRTWETLARSLLQLLATGDVLDIASGDGVTAELLAPHAHSIVCIDSSERVVDAARQRLSSFTNVDVRTGDMHALDLGDRQFDLVLLLHALTYSEQPQGLRRGDPGAETGWTPARFHARRTRPSCRRRALRPSQPRFHLRRPHGHGAEGRAGRGQLRATEPRASRPAFRSHQSSRAQALSGDTP